jgi:transcriptional regulator with XRE-family HTH domain
VDASRVRARRTELGLTRDELAERARLARSTLQLVETEGRASLSTISRVAEALSLAPAQLMLDAGARDHDVHVRALAARGLVPPPPPEVLLGRSGMLTQLRAILAAGPTVLALVGPMGIGKTAIASTLARELSAGGVVAWLSESRLGDTFAGYDLQLRVAEALGFAARMPPPTTPATAIDAIFRAQAGQLLRAVVLDDVRTTRFAAHFAAASTVVCTTHSRAVAEAIASVVIEVPSLEGAESRALLDLYVSSERLVADPEGARRLLDRLGGVPRSLHIAGRALRELSLVQPGEYAARIDADPGAHTAPTERIALDPDERRNASQIVGYEELEAALPASTRALFRALAVFEDRAFSLGWAAGAAGVTRADAARETSLLRDRYLVRDAPSTTSEPRFVLDDHAAWYCRSRAGDLAPHLARLRAHALRAAELLRASDERERDERYAAERDVWSIALSPPTVGRPWEAPDALRRALRAEGVDPVLALSLWRVLATRPGMLEDSVTQHAYVAAHTADEREGTDGLGACAALVAGMRLSAVARDQAIAAAFLLEAGERFARVRPARAVNVWGAAARLLAPSHGPAVALTVMERAKALADTLPSALDRALRTLDVAQMCVWADMFAPPWERIEGELDRVLVHAATLEDSKRVPIESTVAIVRALFAVKRGEADVVSPSLVASLERLEASIETSAFTRGALMGLRAWASGPSGSAARRDGMAAARARFRDALRERASSRSEYGMAEVVWLAWLFRAVPWDDTTRPAILGALDPWVGLAPAVYDPIQPEDPPRFGHFLGVAIPVGCLFELLDRDLLDEAYLLSERRRGPEDLDTQRLRELRDLRGE